MSVGNWIQISVVVGFLVLGLTLLGALIEYAYRIDHEDDGR